MLTSITPQSFLWPDGYIVCLHPLHRRPFFSPLVTLCDYIHYTAELSLAHWLHCVITSITPQTFLWHGGYIMCLQPLHRRHFFSPMVTLCAYIHYTTDLSLARWLARRHGLMNHHPRRILPDMDMAVTVKYVCHQPSCPFNGRTMYRFYISRLQSTRFNGSNCNMEAADIVLETAFHYSGVLWE